jgi:hypothetical protein
VSWTCELSSLLSSSKRILADLSGCHLPAGRDTRPRRRPTFAAGPESCQTAGTMLKTERTKIVATLGPASSNREVLGGMVEAGLDVVRLNFSHGERADHGARFDLVRMVASELGHNLAVLSTSRDPRSGSGWSRTTGSSSTAAARSR